MNKVVKKIVNFYRTWRRHKKLPLRLEFVLTDYCNLNCRGCTHYSPLAAKEFEPLEQLRLSAQKLSALEGEKVGIVYLIGGETLIYPQLTEAMDIVRAAFPEAKLYIFTNGILLPKMSDEFWETALRTHTVISITRYPIRFDYDAVEELCRRKGVEYEVFADRDMADSFFRFALDSKGRQNGRLNHFRCMNHGCVSVVGDKVYPCSISACVGHLNKACGTNFEHQEGDFLLVDDIKNTKEIKCLRDRPVPFCRYCPAHPTVVKYGPSKREACEWVQQDNE